MRKRISILFIALCVLNATMVAQDYVRMSERSLTGSARYVGMGGAMTAIGGDPSAAHDNPAGGGLYQHIEAMFTMGGDFDRTRQVGANTIGVRNSFTMPQASLVVSVPTYTSKEMGVQFHNFLFSYRRLHSFRRTWVADGTNGASLGALLNSNGLTLDIPYATDATNRTNSLQLRESGSVNEFAFDWSMNIGHQLYTGLGLRIQSYTLSADADYYEDFTTLNAEGKRYDIENETSLLFDGVNCNLAFGLIYRPAKWFRMGIGVQTPTIGSYNGYNKGTFSAITDSLRYSYAPDLNYRDTRYHMPWRVSSSIAFQCGAYGMLSFQYDYAHASYQDDYHSLRAGLEVIPLMGLYVNAGYVYESTFKPTQTVGLDPTFDRQDTYSVAPRWTQYVSAAIGYRGEMMMIQAAYQYSWRRTDLYALESAAPYDMASNTHRLVVTLGWRR